MIHGLGADGEGWVGVARVAALMRGRSCYLGATASLNFHQRLNDMRDRTIHESAYRKVCAHALSMVHLQGWLIASAQPS